MKAGKNDFQKRLDRLILMQRLKYSLIGISVVLALASLLFFIGYEQTVHMDKVISSRTIGGTIMQANRVPGRRSGFRLLVKLDDGRSIQASSRLPQTPYEGEHLVLKELRRKSGLKTYIVTRITPSQ